MKRIIDISDLKPRPMVACHRCGAKCVADDRGRPISPEWHVEIRPSFLVVSCPNHRPKSAATLGDVLRAKGWTGS